MRRFRVFLEKRSTNNRQDHPHRLQWSLSLLMPLVLRGGRVKRSLTPTAIPGFNHDGKSTLYKAFIFAKSNWEIG